MKKDNEADKDKDKIQEQEQEQNNIGSLLSSILKKNDELEKRESLLEIVEIQHDVKDIKKEQKALRYEFETYKEEEKDKEKFNYDRRKDDKSGKIALIAIVLTAFGFIANIIFGILKP